MPVIENFPPIFAVIRTQAIPRPCLQILQAESIYGNFYRITNFPGNPYSFRNMDLERMENYQLDPTIFTLKYVVDGHRDVREVKFWSLPYSIRDRNQAIPVLEFQYRSWLPDQYDPIPISRNINGVLHVHSLIEAERLQEIRASEDSNPRYSAQHYDFNSSFWNFPFHSGGPDDWDDRLHARPNSLVGAGAGAGRGRRQSHLRTPSPPPRNLPEIRVVEVEIPVERIVTQIRSQPIPKHVGQILLTNARNGTDSCPIAALTFKECPKLAVSSCFHTFDKESLDRWMETSQACPVCRSKIENVISEEV